MDMGFDGKGAVALEPPRFTLRVSTDMPPFYPWWSDGPR